MNLVLDFGNSSVKIAVFQDGEMINRQTVIALDRTLLEELLSGYPAIGQALISCVGNYSHEVYDYLKSHVKNLIELDKNTPLPVENLYETLDTLGYDRIAGIVAAAAIFPGSHVLVIDAGTAITYDFVNSAGQFLGGNISPGIQTRARALNAFTARLPLTEPGDTFRFPGRNTEEAIVSGILLGILYEVDGYIDELKKKYADLKIILTGGDSKFFDKKLKNRIFVDSNLNLYGLNRILEYNAI